MLWKFDINDITTWKYIDYINGKKNILWVKNPTFAFKHLACYHIADLTVDEARKKKLNMMKGRRKCHLKANHK